MPNEAPKRGAIPSHRSVLAASVPYAARVGAPPDHIVIPQKISFWGNYYDGDCVTAEEAFAKACNNPEIFISDSEVIAWATRHGVLNGAYLPQVMGWMQHDGFPDGPFTYDDGPYNSVDWTNAGTLQSAISQGPVKLGVAGDQLLTVWWGAGSGAAGGVSGWFATGFHDDPNMDHCVSLCGYGSISWLAQQLGVQVPAGVDGTKPGYALFTWDSIGIIDVPSMIAITSEAWFRQPTTVIPLFVSVYLDQMHFTYTDVNGNLQDCWYNGPAGTWNLQQINNANGAGATVPGEYVATAQATAPAAGGVFVCQYNNQDHFSYIDANGNVQDCWYDGVWNLQQINTGNGPSVPGEYVATKGPAATGDLFVSVYNDQMHFTYRDVNGNLQDCWYNGPAGTWNLQQINNANGVGATVPGEYVATAQATVPAVGGVFACQYNNQDHFTYLDANGNIQDCWYDGVAGKWNLQQINTGNGPSVPGEYVATKGPAATGDLFVSVYNNQMHFTYRDINGNLQDCWYNGPAGTWNLQQINNANGAGATVPGEYIATAQATARAA
jgi:subtilisin-like proprotein convertase family protein